MARLRRNPDGTLHGIPSWESFVERQIREAQEAGAFDDLPFRGERLPLEGREDEHWLANNLLRNAGVAPPWIEVDREVRRLLDARDRLVERRRGRATPRDRAELTRLVEQANRLIFRLDYEAPTLRQQRSFLDLAAELVRLDGVDPEGRR